MRTAIILLLAAWVVLGAVEPMSGQAPTKLGAATATALGRLPLYFVENRGVYSDAVRYYIQGADKTLFFTDHAVTIALKGNETGWTVKLGFVGANQDARPEGLDKQEAVFSYFKGPEKDWKAGLPTFSKIVYRDLWPGIDLVYNGTVNKLKYEFQVAPGADPKLIRLEYRGAESVTATDAGALRVATPEGSFEDAPPLAWQEIDGERVGVEMAYALGGGGAFGFTVGDYDRTKPLILDPAVIVYCGFIGGKSSDGGYGIAVDGAGCAYVTGCVLSGLLFPVAVGPDKTHNGNYDAFVAKVAANGTGLLYCGYIGGSDDDRGNGIAVDGKGNAYVAGRTWSSGATFPETVGPDLTPNGRYDGFVAKVNAAGTALVYCGYIGGTKEDWAEAIAVDAMGNAFVTGRTVSDQTTFPVTVGPYMTHNGFGDAFVAKVSATGKVLVYCGYIGGSSDDGGLGVAVDANGSAYVCGFTRSSEATFPKKVGPDLSYNGNLDAFVAKVNANGTGLLYCGYIGGSGDEPESAIAVDGKGNAYIAGTTQSTAATFSEKVGPDLTHNGGADAFVAKVNANGKDLDYCGYIGGARADAGNAIAVDRSGCAYVAGVTISDQSTFPEKVGPVLTIGTLRGFIAKVDASGSGLVYCGYVGQSQGVAVDRSQNAYLTGDSGALFPLVKVGPSLTFAGGGGDAVVAKIALLDDLTTSGTPRPGATVTMNLAAIEARGLPYQMGTSVGTGPIKVDTRKIGLSVDGLLEISVGGKWPHVFKGYSGMLDSQGKATAKIIIPNAAALIGQRLYSAFVTLDPSWPSGVRSISETRTITITQ